MGYPTKVQRITRKASEQWYINFPAALAAAMEFERGEVVEWVVEDKANLLLRRKGLASQEAKGGLRPAASRAPSTSSSPPPKEPPASGAAQSAPTPSP
jgi:hypothetical protein